MTDGMKSGAGDDPFADDEADDNGEPSATAAADDATGDTAGLPWKYRRQNARDGRPHTKQIHLQASTERREDTFRSDVQSAVDEKVELTDLREAALLVAMDHVDEVADQLREWGYDHG
jgi:hypothetical protein